MVLRALSSDPFDFPLHVLPPGVSYQWCAKEPAKDFDKFTAAGWRPVPYQRHPTLPAMYMGIDGSIQYGGQVLMERHRELSLEAREIEMDQACLNAGRGRQVAVNVVVNVDLSQDELRSALTEGISGQAWAQKSILYIANGASVKHIYGRGGALHFEMPILPPQPIRCKYRWLNWLFALLSTEK